MSAASQAGAAVTFTVDAYPRRQFTGTVRLVRLQPTTVQNVVTYTTIIDVPNADGQLRPGMTSTVSIETARADQALRIPAAALRFTPSEAMLKEFGAASVAEDPLALAASPGRGRAQAIWRLSNGQLHRMPVRVGVSDGTQVEVSADGLVEGTSIITGVARSEQPAAAAATGTGSPLMPQMPRRPTGNSGGNTGGAAGPARQGS